MALLDTPELRPHLALNELSSPAPGHPPTIQPMRSCWMPCWWMAGRMWLAGVWVAVECGTGECGRWLDVRLEVAGRGVAGRRHGMAQGVA
jgi:hypothetical protein